MKDNRFFKVVRAMRDHALNKVQAYFERRTPRQRVRIVVCLLILFTLVDLWLIVQGFMCGGDGGIPPEHIQPLNP